MTWPPVDREELRRLAVLADRRQREQEARYIRHTLPGVTDDEQTD